MWEIEQLEMKKKIMFEEKCSKLTGNLWIKHISASYYKNFKLYSDLSAELSIFCKIEILEHF